MWDSYNYQYLRIEVKLDVEETCYAAQVDRWPRSSKNWLPRIAIYACFTSLPTERALRDGSDSFSDLASGLQSTPHSRFACRVFEEIALWRRALALLGAVPTVSRLTNVYLGAGICKVICSSMASTAKKLLILHKSEVCLVPDSRWRSRAQRTE